MRPEARRIYAFLLPRIVIGSWVAIVAMGPARAVSLDVVVHASDDHPLEGVVVTAFALDGDNKPLAPVHTVVDQLNLKFAPDLVVVPVGSTVEFPNSDSTSHQVYSFSPAHPFKLPLYRGKPYPPVRFDQPGVVTLGCNIHDDMLAYVVVTNARFFGRTDSLGKWGVPDVPRGRYRIEIWHPRLREPATAFSKEVTVSDAEHSDVTIRINKPLRPAPLQDRPRSWNAY